MMKNDLTILGIETSCDETSASLLNIKNHKFKIVSNVVFSQVKIHAQYGGIVPEVAARKHAENIVFVLETVINPKKISFDAIAVTNGPGLITSLLVGVEAAKTLAFLTNKPLIPVNHLVAHIYSSFINNWPLEIKNFLPAVCLVVSGGHTELILMKDFEKFEKIGQTLDDAAGECFDKVAKILGLGYPGGPIISEYAKKWKSQTNSKILINLPRPMINSPDFNFSFSGLKTAVLYKTRQLGDFKTSQLIPLICHEVEKAIVEVLVEKTIKAVKKFKAKSIILGGGVTANDFLRKSFKTKIKNLKLKINLFIPPKKLSTDNAVMVALAGYFKLKKTPRKDWLKKFAWRKIEVDPNLEI
jgi:N6-L-threonylcarbamoyladenine synthase